MSDSSQPLVPAAAANPAPVPAPQTLPANEFDLAAEEVAFDTAFDPADYRWVPIRRRRRVDGWTPERQRRFIEVLADTGIVRQAAQAVNMTEQAAHALRRAPGAEGFAAAWRAALDHAADLLASVAFARAIEGEERTIFDANGCAVGARIHYNDRLLQFLLRAHRPEQYGRAHGSSLPAPAAPPASALRVAEALRAMEPQLPGPPEQAADFIETDLQVADIADGELPSIWRDWVDPQDFALSPETEAELDRLKHARDDPNLTRPGHDSGLNFD